MSFFPNLFSNDCKITSNSVWYPTNPTSSLVAPLTEWINTECTASGVWVSRNPRTWNSHCSQLPSSLGTGSAPENGGRSGVFMSFLGDKWASLVYVHGGCHTITLWGWISLDSGCSNTAVALMDSGCDLGWHWDTFFSKSSILLTSSPNFLSISSNWSVCHSQSKTASLHSVSSSSSLSQSWMIFITLSLLDSKQVTLVWCGPQTKLPWSCHTTPHYTYSWNCFVQTNYCFSICDDLNTNWNGPSYFLHQFGCIYSCKQCRGHWVPIILQNMQQKGEGFSMECGGFVPSFFPNFTPRPLYFPVILFLSTHVPTQWTYQYPWISLCLWDIAYYTCNPSYKKSKTHKQQILLLICLTHGLTPPINTNSLEQLLTYFHDYYHIHYSVLQNVRMSLIQFTDGAQQGVHVWLSSLIGSRHSYEVNFFRNHHVSSWQNVLLLWIHFPSDFVCIGQGHWLHLCSSTSYHLVFFQTPMAATPNYPGGLTSMFLQHTPVCFTSPSNMAMFSSTSSCILVSNITFQKFVLILLLMTPHIGHQFLSQFLGAKVKATKSVHAQGIKRWARATSMWF